MTLAEERAARGAAWYDARMPGWADKIDLSRLDILDVCNCIRGQLDGIEPDEPVVPSSDEWEEDFYPQAYGFDAQIGVVGPVEIEAAWTAEILRRRTP